jgi:hypothetical protein
VTKDFQNAIGAQGKLGLGGEICRVQVTWNRLMVNNYRKGRNCDYSSPGPDVNKATGPWPYPSPLDESPRSSKSIDFATILFMDPTILQYGQVEIPRTTHPVPAHILQLVGDMTDVNTTASTYFETIHVWMPVICKRRFYDYHLRPTFHCHAEVALLLLSMKLVTSLLPKESADPRTPAYNAAKHFHLEMEASGVMSVQVLQAGLLLSLYELGHAIYPSAYLSIGASARYAYALGINKDAKTQASKVLTLVEMEENKRVWWGIVILDRFEFSHLIPPPRADSFRSLLSSLLLSNTSL